MKTVRIVILQRVAGTGYRRRLSAMQHANRAAAESLAAQAQAKGADTPHKAEAEKVARDMEFRESEARQSLARAVAADVPRGALAGRDGVFYARPDAWPPAGELSHYGAMLEMAADMQPAVSAAVDADESAVWIPAEAAGPADLALTAALAGVGLALVEPAEVAALIGGNDGPPPEPDEGE